MARAAGRPRILGGMHYLDHAATTPLLPEVVELQTALEEVFGNPSSVHSYGRRAKAVVEDARDAVATAIGARAGEITFTGGGTEADNTALKGAVDATGTGHVVTTAIEHHAVLDSVRYLARRGCETTVVPVGPSGLLEPGAIAAAVRSDTGVVSVMAVNNEIGTIQPIAEIVAAVKGVNPAALVHTDAVQALGNVTVDVALWGVDLAAFAAHKLGGPKGVGALYARSGVELEPLIHGGGQERGLRSGTVNVTGVAGFGAAAAIAAKEVDGKAARLLALRTSLLEGLRERIPDVVVNGDERRRIAGNVNVSVPGAEGETMLMLLDRVGIACSSGSACASGALDPSHVLLAIGVTREGARGSLRFSLGRASTASDVDAVLDALPAIAGKARTAA